MNAQPEPMHMIQVSSLRDNLRDLAYHLDRLGKYAHPAANDPRLKSQINLWCEALESGAYEKTKEVLYDGRGAYCAVGVYASACVGLPNEDIEDITDIYELDIGLPAGISQALITSLNDETVLNFRDIAAVLRWACKMGPPFIFKTEVTHMSVHDFIVKYHPLPESAHVNKQAVG